MPVKPKILHVVGEGFGGGSVLIRELALEAVRQGYGVDVLSANEEFADFTSGDPIGIIRENLIRRPISPGTDLAAIRRLTNLVRDRHYCVVHTHTSKGGIIGRLAAWKAHAPIVIHTVHGFPFHEGTPARALRVMSAVEKAAARRCHRIVTVSEFHREWALQLGIAEPPKIVAIPNGIREDRVASSTGRIAWRKQLGIPEDSRLIVACGRLAPQKGFEHLIRATSLVESPSRVVVAIAGEGPLGDELQNLSDSIQSQTEVRLLGFRRDIGALLEAADIVALPSEWEGLSISLLEAMAAGKPIVTTSIGSNREVTEDGKSALLVPARDHRSLARAISSLLMNPGRAAALGVEARSRFERAYTQDRMLASYLSLYRNPLGYGI